MDRHGLVLGFNITSANQGQDAEILRGLGDEMWRAMGIDPEAMELVRKLYGGEFLD